jgi:Uncharacterized conserved protein (DUF2304)
MSPLFQILLAGAIGLSFAFLILSMARRGIISMRYTLGWFFVSLCVVLGGIFGRLANPIGRILNIEPISIVLAAALAGILAITVQLSITASGLTERIRTLAESHALLEERVSRIVDSSASPD